MVSYDDVQGRNVIHVKFGVVVADDVLGRSIDDDSSSLPWIKSYADGSVAPVMPDQFGQPCSTSRGCNRQVDFLAIGLFDPDDLGNLVVGPCKRMFVDLLLMLGIKEYLEQLRDCSMLGDPDGELQRSVMGGIRQEITTSACNSAALPCKSCKSNSPQLLDMPCNKFLDP